MHHCDQCRAEAFIHADFVDGGSLNLCEQHLEQAIVSMNSLGRVRLESKLIRIGEAEPLTRKR